MKKEAYIWTGVAVLGGALVMLLFLRRQAVIMTSNGGLLVPPFEFPDINIGDFVVPQRERWLYAGYYPCACGCDGNDVNVPNLADDAATGLDGVQIGSSSRVPGGGGIGLPSANIGPAIFFSDLPDGRVPVKVF